MDNLFIPLSYQIALFFDDKYTFKSLSIATRLTEVFEEVFSQEPSVYNPNDNNLPSNFPRIIFDEKSAGQLTVSALRADLHLNFNDKYTIDNIPSMVENFANCFPIKHIAHFGLVCIYRLNDDITIADMTDKYVLNNKINNILDFQIGWTRKFKFGSCNVKQFVHFYFSEKNQRTLTVDHNTMLNDICQFTDVRDIKNLSKFMLKQLGSNLYDTLEWN